MASIENSNTFIHFERLKKERNRLGFTQEKFATQAGVSHRIYAAWEAGEAAPTAAHLAALAKAGADVQYIITGEPSVSALTPDEHQLLQLFRVASSTERMEAIGALQDALNPGGLVIASSNNKAAGRDLHCVPTRKARRKEKTED